MLEEASLKGLDGHEIRERGLVDWVGGGGGGADGGSDVAPVVMELTLVLVCVGDAGHALAGFISFVVVWGLCEGFDGSV
jgi:hypothetical protein